MHIVQCRRQYLHQITELRRQDRPIFFTDETWVNGSHTHSWVWIDGTIQSVHKARQYGLSNDVENASDKGGRLTVIHCGSEHEFAKGAAEVFYAKKSTGDHYKEINRHHYKKWFSQKLIHYSHG